MSPVPVHPLTSADTGTGVAYHQPNRTPRQPESEAVRRLFWDSESTIEKVPTRLAYELEGPGREPISWGMHVPVDGDGILVQEWFKTKFGQPDIDQAPVERLFLDYLSALYTDLSVRFAGDLPNGKAWVDANVSFCFSTPSIWDTALVGRGVHTVDVSLVEPQAAASLHLCSKDVSVQFKVSSPIPR